MLEIFVPQKIFGEFSLNIPQRNMASVLEKSFENIEIKEFQTELLSGVSLFLHDYDEDLLIYANGAFGKKYFYDYDYDFTKYKPYTFGKAFYKTNDYFHDLETIETRITELLEILHSNILLTNTKKIEIREKIEYIFFLISGAYFTLLTLLQKTNENISELDNIDDEAEYEAMASLIVESSKTKKNELEAVISRLEEQAKMFYDIISKIFMK